MVRQAAFENVKKHLKGALHCHTTRSDGQDDPKDVILNFKAHGYDFAALTDHRRYNYENYAPEAGITIIPGMELDFNYTGEGHHCHHIVTIGPVKMDGNLLEHDETFDRAWSEKSEDCQECLDEMHKRGNMTFYAHPDWSGVTAEEIDAIEGNFAMEVWNSGCALTDSLDTNAPYWDDVLIRGKRIYGVATDDAHSSNQYCRGWAMVNAENNVASILEALKRGAFYSSCGPEIYDFRVDDDGKVRIECSPVKEIQFRCLRYPYRSFKAAGDDTITAAEVNAYPHFYVRATVVDSQGRRAWTNPIFFS